jgi:phytoene dehydrogenase-like protein
LKRIVIIGGGISGLSAGIYALQAGYEAVIYERNAVPGGVIATWERGGYKLGGCIEWITGTNPKTELYPMWQNLGVIEDGQKFNEHENYSTYYLDGKTVNVTYSLDSFRKELLSVAPEDEKAINSFVSCVRKLQCINFPAKGAFKYYPLHYAALACEMLRIVPVALKYYFMDFSRYSRRFTNTTLKKFFSDFFAPNESILAFMASMGIMTSGNGKMVSGGAAEIIQKMSRRFTDLGGKLMLNSPVTAISYNGRKVDGVIVGGEKVTADFVVSSCDPYVTYRKLLSGAFCDKALERKYADSEKYQTRGCSNVFFLLKGNCKSLPHRICFLCEPFTAGVTQKKRLSFISLENGSSMEKDERIYYVNIDQFDDDFRYWEALRARSAEEYSLEKTRMAQDVRSRIASKLDFENNGITCEVIDITTPKTYNFYTGGYNGAYMPFVIGLRSLPAFYSNKVRGLDGCYIASQWINPPGGLPSAAVSGKFVIEEITKKDRNK